VILIVPELPAPILTEAELSEIPKSGGSASVTATIIVVVCESDPLVAVMVTV